MNLSELDAEMMRLSRLIDAGVEQIVTQVKRLAEAEQAYRKAQAQAWVKIPDPDMIAKEKEAWVNGQCADLRYERDLADGMRRAAFKAVAGRMQQLSALQTRVSAWKAEFEHAAYGPGDGP